LSTFYLIVKQLQKSVLAKGAPQIKCGGSGSTLSELLVGIPNFISRCYELWVFRTSRI